jgi:hypothetical protein
MRAQPHGRSLLGPCMSGLTKSARQRFFPRMNTLRFAALALAATVAACSSSPEASEPTADATATADVTPPPATTADTSASADVTATADTAATPTASAAATGSGKAMVGGFSDADPASADVVAAAKKAIELLKTDKKDPSIALKTVKSAKTQVVAGMNYDLVLDVTTKKGPKTVTVRVLKDLKDKYTLGTVEGL